MGRQLTKETIRPDSHPSDLLLFIGGAVETDHFCPLPSSKSVLSFLFTVRVSSDNTQITYISGHSLGNTSSRLFRLPSFPPLRLSKTPTALSDFPRARSQKMTDVVAASSHQRHLPAPTGPITRSAMAAKPGGPPPAAAARQHGSETTTLAAPSSSPGSPPPPELAKEPPRRPITRKRAASINTEEANRSKIASLSLTTPNTASPRPLDASGGSICLCTPAPKVPRPRNGRSYFFCSCRNCHVMRKRHYDAAHLSLSTLSCHFRDPLPPLLFVAEEGRAREKPQGGRNLATKQLLTQILT